MRAAAILFVAALAVVANAYIESNDLNKSPKEIISEENLMSENYDIVVFIGDSYNNMAPELRSIRDAIVSYLDVRP